MITVLLSNDMIHSLFIFISVFLKPSMLLNEFHGFIQVGHEVRTSGLEHYLGSACITHPA